MCANLYRLVCPLYGLVSPTYTAKMAALNGLMARKYHLQIGIMVSQITWDLMEAMKTVRSFILQTEVGMT